MRQRRLAHDEAQNIENPKAARTRAVRKIATERRLPLSGIPVERRLSDFRSIFQLPSFATSETRRRIATTGPNTPPGALSRS